MNTTQILKPVLDNGLRSINFFNGRLLSGEDMSQEQTSNREGRRQLGQLLGAGIAYGLEVEPAVDASPVTEPVAAKVTVRAGLAINRQGQVLNLPNDISVGLVATDNQPNGTADIFSECQPPQSSSIFSGAGVYLLTMSPASGFEGRASVSGLNNNTVASVRCGARYVVEGIQFALVELTLSLIGSISLSARNEISGLLSRSDSAGLSLLRNKLAHLCFGTEQNQGFAADPFAEGDNNTSPYLKYGIVDVLSRLNILTDCDLPLALLYWTVGGLQFIDNWAIRRRMTSPALTLRWPLLNDRRLSESEATLLQFQAQLDDLQLSGLNLSTLNATDYFTWLPPAGLLPLNEGKSSTGVKREIFFGSLGSQEMAILDGVQLRSLFHKALYYEPVKLDSDRKFQLYGVWENMKAAEQGQSNQLTLVFATSAMSYRGVARFGYSKTGRSRFAPEIL